MKFIDRILAEHGFLERIISGTLRHVRKDMGVINPENYHLVSTRVANQLKGQLLVVELDSEPESDLERAQAFKIHQLEKELKRLREKVWKLKGSVNYWLAKAGHKPE